MTGSGAGYRCIRTFAEYGLKLPVISFIIVIHYRDSSVAALTLVALFRRC